MSSEHLFTLPEALALLPTVRQMVIELQAKKQDFDESAQELERLEGLTGGNGHFAADVERAREAVQVRRMRLESLMEEMASLGVLLKGIDEGLVDFPSEHEGRSALLCWQLGEETIGWWHDEATGFPGRKPLDQNDW